VKRRKSTRELLADVDNLYRESDSYSHMDQMCLGGQRYFS